MIRVVLDTNVIVSALLQPLGPPASVFLLVAGGAVQLSISGDVYAEYEEVIRRPRLARDEEVIAAMLGTVRPGAFWTCSRRRLGQHTNRFGLSSIIFA
jgi:hypothetical protein